MKHLNILLVLPFLFSQSSAQWTAPRLVDSTVTSSQANPLISVGPNRELVILLNEFSGAGKLVCYKSTDLGITFNRILIAEGGSGGIWVYDSGTPSSIGFDHAGNSFLLSYSSFGDMIVMFVSNSIKRMKSDSSSYSNLWGAQVTNGLRPQDLLPNMTIQDTVIHSVRGIQDFQFRTRIIYTRFSGANLQSQRDFDITTLSSGRAFADVKTANSTVRIALSYSDASLQNSKLFYTRKFENDSMFASLVPIDTLYATLPQIVDAGEGRVAIVYASGNGTDSILTMRILNDSLAVLSSPVRLTAKPILPSSSGPHRSRIVCVQGPDGKYHVAYRSFTTTSILAAYYEFQDLHSSPTDSAFFPGFDYPDIAVDSLGGKYLVMVGPDGRVYLSQKDIVSGVQDVRPTPSEFALEQNFPNPFNPTTRIRFQVPNSDFVSLKVFTLLGQEIVTLVNETRSAGVHEMLFDAVNLPSGVYFYQLKTGQFFQTKKMVLLR